MVPMALQEIMPGIHWVIIAVLCYDVNWKQHLHFKRWFFLAINFGILFQIFQSLARYPQLFCWHFAAVAPSLRWVGFKVNGRFPNPLASDGSWGTWLALVRLKRTLAHFFDKKSKLIPTPVAQCQPFVRNCVSWWTFLLLNSESNLLCIFTTGAEMIKRNLLWDDPWH